MIQRIVKMEFRADELANFLILFRQVKEKIEQCEGCQGLQLLADIKDPSVLFTYSIWSDEKALNKYRDSDLFKETWSKAKALFRAKAEAWSLALAEN